MRIRPGEPWGEVALLPSDAPIAGSDAELAHLAQLNRHRPDVVIGVAAGDICRTLGGRGDVERRRGSITTIVPIDVAVASFSGSEHLFVAHLVAHGRNRPGSGAVVMNADRLGRYLLAPRAHPGDGLLDVIEGSLPLRQFLLARGRARSGDHLPHPNLSTARTASVHLDFAHPVTIRLDGTRHSRSRQISIRLTDHQLLVAV